MKILGYEFDVNDAKKEAADFWESVAKHVPEGKEFIFNENKDKLTEGKTTETIDALICEAVRRSFHDLTVRTMTRKDKNKSMNLDKLAELVCNKDLLKKELHDQDILDEDLLEKIKEWFGNRTDYDMWHQEACEKIIIPLLKIYYEDESCTYGKAQKVVNMTFKQLYSFCCHYDKVKGTNHADNKKFEPCHMPLDSFVLEWVKREIQEVQDNKSNRIGSWSKLTFDEKDNDNHYTYTEYVGWIRNHFNNKGLTPLQAEALIWPLIQQNMAAEGFIFALMDKDKIENANKYKKNVIKKTLREKFEDIENVMEAFKDNHKKLF